MTEPTRRVPGEYAVRAGLQLTDQRHEFPPRELLERVVAGLRDATCDPAQRLPRCWSTASPSTEGRAPLSQRILPLHVIRAVRGCAA